MTVDELLHSLVCQHLRGSYIHGCTLQGMAADAPMRCRRGAYMYVGRFHPICLEGARSWFQPPERHLFFFLFTKKKGKKEMYLLLLLFLCTGPNEESEEEKWTKHPPPWIVTRARPAGWTPTGGSG